MIHFYAEPLSLNSLQIATLETALNWLSTAYRFFVTSRITLFGFR